MNRLLYLYLLFTLLTTGLLSAQTKIHTEWASSVIEASSELSPREFSAPQTLGTPNVTPGSGNSPNAWMPHSNDKVEFIKLGFEENFRVRQIAIVESVNPGAISAIFIYDKADNEFLLNTFQPEEIPLDNRILHIFF
jgi:OmpA-OmpF porin, OOP family